MAEAVVYHIAARITAARRNVVINAVAADVALALYSFQFLRAPQRRLQHTPPCTVTATLFARPYRRSQPHPLAQHTLPLSLHAQTHKRTTILYMYTLYTHTRARAYIIYVYPTRKGSWRFLPLVPAPIVNDGNQRRGEQEMVILYYTKRAGGAAGRPLCPPVQRR